MHKPGHISPDLTVRQVAQAWPACAARLDRYASARVDGRWSLQELGPFARDQGIAEQALLAELAAAAQVPVGATSRRGADVAPIRVIGVALALGLSLGAGWGVWLLLRIALQADFAAATPGSVHVHGVAQLWGWMGLFVFAVATHLLRQTTRRPAPPALEYGAAALVVAAVGLFFAGLLEPVREALPYVHVVGSVALAGAAGLFGVSVMWSLSGRGKGQRGYALLLLVGWLWAWAGMDVWLRVRYVDAPILPAAARSLLIVLPVLGFATGAIYAFGTRLIPGLLNIGRLRSRWLDAGIVMHNVGLGLFLVPARLAGIAGAGMMLAAAVSYLVGMNGLRSKPARAIYGVDVRGHVLIRVAFAWLVVGLAMVLIEQIAGPLPHAYGGAWRHALTVGFITTMILGVGQRLVPIIIRQPLASTRLMLISAALIIVGNAGRVGLELATIGQWPWTYRLMGVTGLLELTAIGLFAFNLAWTVRQRRHVPAPGECLTAATRVRDAVNADPALQQRLNAAGITMFDQARFIAPSMTIGALALASGFSPTELLERLSAPGQPHTLSTP